jgi:ethanolamine permease
VAVGEALRAMLAIPAIALVGLIGLLPSIIYAYSRQLSRADYLPTALSVTDSRKALTLALIVPGLIGFVLSLSSQGPLLLTMAAFGAALSYALMIVSHIVLRRREPEIARPYGNPGGVVTTGSALVVAVLTVITTFLMGHVSALCCLVVFALLMAFFALHSRHLLVANSPDEEFAALAAAEGAPR